MTATVAENCVVSMAYVLRDTEGNLLDASDEKESFEYLQGHHNIIPALEQALLGLKPGDQKQVQLPPESGYGHYDPNLCFAVERAQFGDQAPEVGMMIQLSTQEGQPFVARITEVALSQVTIDANHPLAGKSLVFDVQIHQIRPATEEEITHGHPHGPGGHHHH